MVLTSAREIEVNRNVLDMEYAVRGPIPQRAAELARQGRRIIPCNIGNPQALGQRPIGYFRQVLGLVEDPERLARERRFLSLRGELDGLADEDLVDEEVLARCERFLGQMATGMGAYTDSNGARFIREAVADFIDRRDGVPAGSPLAADPDRIFLTNGASIGVKHLIDLLVAGPADGIMIPIPQYPLYSASIRKAGGVQVDYYPDEDAGWTFDRAQLDEAYEQASRQGVRVKAIVVINPGNPTGAVLDRATIEAILDFAELRGLMVIADEVYQENVYDPDAAFVSFAEVLGERPVALASLHSVSKGFVGECGHRGGYLELRNPPPISGSTLNVAQIMLKQASVELCSNTAGQLLVYLMVDPPRPGSAAWPRYEAERAGILSELQAKASMIRAGFDEMAGVRCFGRTGAMYLFPRLEALPPGRSDFDYCMDLLEATGLVTVNGAGFGQREGTQHLRIAFLPPRPLIEEVLPRWIDFHRAYVGGASML